MRLKTNGGRQPCGGGCCGWLGQGLAFVIDLPVLSLVGAEYSPACPCPGFSCIGLDWIGTLSKTLSRLLCKYEQGSHAGGFLQGRQAQAYYVATAKVEVVATSTLSLARYSRDAQPGTRF